MLVLDGAHGEGGGQILRSALSLAAIGRRPVRIERIRAGRSNPGLAAQHLAALLAAAALCDAEVEGAALGSQELVFAPRRSVAAGEYRFDVGAMRPGGSAGAATLVLQTVLLPLALASGRSSVSVRGGTHMAWSPSYDYLQSVWIPALRQIGIRATVALAAWGFFPIGRGEIATEIEGLSAAGGTRLRPIDILERGKLCAVEGRAIAANIPPQIALRMVERARSRLAPLAVPLAIEALPVRAACAGAGLFLTAIYERIRCGFSALGTRGKPAEVVADEATSALLDHHACGAAADTHLADQLLLPLALADAPSRFTAARATAHLATNAWVAESFGLARIDIAAAPDGTVNISVRPRRATAI